MKATSATLAEALEAWPGVQRITLSAPDLGQVAAGQCVLVHVLRSRDSILPIALVPSSHDLSTGLLAALGSESALVDRFGAESSGNALQVLGPFGRPFVVDRRSRRALLLGSGSGLGALLFLARRLVADGQDVTFISAAVAPAEPMPPVMLPHDVEYLTVPHVEGEDTADALIAAAEPLLSWADALYTALPLAYLDPLLRSLRRRLLRLRKGFAQALIAPGTLPCGIAACDLCTIATRDGYRRLCRDGLVFDLLSLA